MLSALKNFGVTFLISSALFGVIAYFATGFVTSTVSSILDKEEQELDNIINSAPDGEATSSDSAAESGDEEQIPQGESFNFLVITTDYRPDLYNDYTPTLEIMLDHNWYSTPPEDTMGSLSSEYRENAVSSIVLVRIDKERRQFVYTYFTPETQVYTTTGYHTLSDVYQLYGKEAVAEHIHAMTGLRVKYTALINGYNFDELIGVLGTVNAGLGKDIYRDGTGSYTMQYETAVEMTGPNGGKWTERYPNTWVMGGGDTELNGDTMYTILTVEERSSADIEAKKNAVIGILQKYLTALVSMEEEYVKYNLAKLVNKEADWVNLKEPGTEETTVDTDMPAIDNTGADLPFDITPADPSVGNLPETEDTLPETIETAETDEFGNPIPEETLSPWLTELHEPENPIVETNYTMNDFDAVYQLLSSIAEFEAVVINYPGKFTAATETEDARFEGNLTQALEIFMPYRSIAE